jgi:hypothetical protein
VDWHPWGEEALERARVEDKPIFLSIGYSTCHWCHVMERESFENEAVAQVLNQHFIPIKVDREERPDLDRVYMLFVQATTGSGGWPMSVWLTPEGKPFFGGTYFPPDNRYGRPGFRHILESLAKAWKEDRPKIEESGAQVIEQLGARASQEAAAQQIDVDKAFDGTYNYYRRAFDKRLGGFGPAPKFPRPSIHNFLLRYADKTGNEDARDMVFATLDAMAKGGMNDQLGGGFHRYSVDDHWFVPHFEKMLYDQAQLAISYVEAYQITAEERYADVARDIFEYVLRDLGHAEGGFYSAEDADSLDPDQPVDADGHAHKREGAFYVWTHKELVDALGPDDAAVVVKRYGVGQNGNVDEDPHNEFPGRNILFQAHDANHDEELIISRSIPKLLRVRGKRPRPHLDDKILTAWNGLMISAFAKGAQALGEPRYGEAASSARTFLKTQLWRDSDKTLLRRYRDGEAAIEGFLDDYAFLITGLLDIYEAEFDSEDLRWAEQLADRAIQLFEDKQDGGFFSTQAGQSDLVLRLKDDYDGAEPSGNSVLILALLRLARFRDRPDLRAAADRALASFSNKLSTQGPGLPQMLVGLMFAASKPMEIVLSGPREELGIMLGAIHCHFLPNAIVMLGEDAPQRMSAVNHQPTAYVCENFACQLPVTDVEELEKLLVR